MNLLHHIINFKGNEAFLNKKLSNKNVNFEALYNLASEQVVVPTLKNAIKQKKIEPLFPEDFLNAIDYICDLNKQRNIEIERQIQHISKVFNQNNIDYVFIKGCALFVKKFYRSKSDRMIGDIDILVSKNDINRANRLLITNSYVPTKHREKQYFVKHRHLPRLVSKQWISAVELHHKIIDKKEKQLTPTDVLQEKECFQGIPIPCNKHLLYTLIFNDQINDLNYHKWTMSYKTLYDFLVIEQKANPKHLLDINNKYVRRFFLLKWLYYDKNQFKTTSIENIKLKFLKWRLNKPKFNKLYNYLVVKRSLLPLLPARFINLFINLPYLKYSIRKMFQFVNRF